MDKQTPKNPHCPAAFINAIVMDISSLFPKCKSLTSTQSTRNDMDKQTPRTDAELAFHDTARSDGNSLASGMIMFARQLETELAAALSQIEDTKEYGCMAAKFMALEDKVERLTQELAAANARFPVEMQGCTIVFKECGKGHGRLLGTNWVDHGCTHCELAAANARAEAAERKYHLSELNFNAHEKLLIKAESRLRSVAELLKESLSAIEEIHTDNCSAWCGYRELRGKIRTALDLDTIIKE